MNVTPTVMHRKTTSILVRKGTVPCFAAFLRLIAATQCTIFSSYTKLDPKSGPKSAVHSRRQHVMTHCLQTLPSPGMGPHVCVCVPPPPHVCVRNKPVWFPPLHPPPILPMPLGGGGGESRGNPGAHLVQKRPKWGSKWPWIRPQRRWPAHFHLRGPAPAFMLRPSPPSRPLGLEASPGFTGEGGGGGGQMVLCDVILTSSDLSPPSPPHCVWGDSEREGGGGGRREGSTAFILTEGGKRKI